MATTCLDTEGAYIYICEYIQVQTNPVTDSLLAARFLRRTCEGNLMQETLAGFKNTIIALQDWKLRETKSSKQKIKHLKYLQAIFCDLKAPDAMAMVWTPVSQSL